MEAAGRQVESCLLVGAGLLARVVREQGGTNLGPEVIDQLKTLASTARGDRRLLRLGLRIGYRIVSGVKTYLHATQCPVFIGKQLATRACHPLIRTRNIFVGMYLLFGRGARHAEMLGGGKRNRRGKVLDRGRRNQGRDRGDDSDCGSDLHGDLNSAGWTR